jgi:hypothetical protein
MYALYHPGSRTCQPVPVVPNDLVHVMLSILKRKTQRRLRPAAAAAAAVVALIAAVP